jgi:hypothetical protein
MTGGLSLVIGSKKVQPSNIIRGGRQNGSKRKAENKYPLPMLSI